MARSKYELKAHEELEQEGYLVDFKIRPRFVPRKYRVDFFGVFDLIAVRPQDAFVRWISIKGVAGNRGQNMKEIEALKLPPGNQKEIWYVRTVKKKKEWVKKILS